MSRIVSRILQIGACFFLCLIVPGCPSESGGRVTSRDGSEDRVTVVCTTTMIADLANQLAGDHVDVRGIMKPGEDPHVYDVRPRDAELLAEADLVLTNGFHLEATLDRIAKKHTPGKVVALAEVAVTEPLSGTDNKAAPDPHCWMSVPYFRGYAKAALDALIEVDPAHADEFRANAKRYDAELAELDTWIRKEMATVPRDRRVIVTSHDAFGYLGQAYEVDVHAVIGISTEQAPRPQDIEALEAMIREKGIRALFIETSVSATLNELVKKTAKATGVNIGGTLYSDSLGDTGTPAGTYTGMMRHNVSTIVNALK